MENFFFNSSVALNGAASLKVYFSGSQYVVENTEDPRPILGICRIKTIFTMMLRCYCSFMLCQYLHWLCKTNGGKTAATLSRIKAVAPHCTMILYSDIQLIKNKIISLNILDRAARNITFIKSWLLSTCVFYVLYGKMESVY